MVLTLNKELLRNLADAHCYEEWKSAAIAYDQHKGFDKWKDDEKSNQYDHSTIRRRLDQLELFRKANDNQGLLFTLNEGIHGNLGGMGSSALYQKAKFGTKHLISNYVNEVSSALKHLARPRVKGINEIEKEDFFHRANLCFGSTALLMSGSGTYLFFHIGVIKALWEQDLIPQVISGSSGGAMIAAIIGSRKHKEIGEMTLKENLTTESELEIVLGKVSLLTNKGGTTEDLTEVVERLIPDLTFEEAYKLSGLKINISIAPAEQHQKSRLLNAITSPNVMLREAVIASCSVPGVFPPVKLAAKNVKGERVPYLPNHKWVDGSLSDDLPMKRLSRLYGVNHFIVSQTNPLILPFLSAEKKDDGIISTISQTSLKTMKDWGLAASHLLQRPLNADSYMSKIINGYISVVSQTYTGDINILPSRKILNPATALAVRTEEEIDELISDGERATWPLIEKIRIQTKISRTLRSILDSFDQRRINSEKDASEKAKLTVVAK